MKRILTLLVTLMLLLSAALADAPAYSPEMTALKTANALMYEKYGFTWRTLGVLTTEITSAEDSTIVTYRSYLLPASRMGKYTVTISGGQANITWTHEGADAAQWQSGDPESPIWGAAQVESYLAQGGGERSRWLKPYFAANEQQADPPPMYGDRFSIAPHNDGDIPLEQARYAADAALTDIFALSADDASKLDRTVDACAVQSEDGRRLWSLTYADYESCFYIHIDAATGEVVYITHQAGGNG